MNALLNIAYTTALRNWTLMLFPLAATSAALALRGLGTHTTDATSLGTLMRALTMFALPVAVIPAAVVGLNLFAQDLRERKLGFFLARPCAPWQLWVGRLLGAAVICSVGWIVCVWMMPLLGSDVALIERGPLNGFQGFVLATILLGVVLVANSMASLVAANSLPWLIADLIALVVFLAATFWTALQAASQGSPFYAWDQLLVLAVCVIVALFFAGLAFVSARNDDGASRHRAHFLVFWSVAAVALLGLAAHREYEWRRPLSSELTGGMRGASATSAGPSSVMISITGRRTPSVFLLDLKTGSSERKAGFAAVWPLTNASTGLAVFAEPRLDFTRLGGGQAAFQSSRLRISREGAASIELEVPPFARVLDVTPAGDMVIFDTRAGFLVVRTSDGSVVSRSTTHPRFATFRGDGNIWVAAQGAEETVSLSLVSPRGEVIRQTMLPVARATWTMTAHEESGRIAITQDNIGTVLYDADGKPIATLAPPLSNYSTVSGKRVAMRDSVAFSKAGDLLVVSGAGLQIVRHDETQASDLPLTWQGQALVIRGFRSISGVLDSDDIVVNEIVSGVFSSLVVDPLTREVRVRLPGLRSMGRRDVSRLMLSSVTNDDAAARLFENEKSDLLVLDPGASEPRLLVRSTSPPS